MLIKMAVGAVFLDVKESPFSRLDDYAFISTNSRIKTNAIFINPVLYLPWIFSDDPADNMYPSQPGKTDKTASLNRVGKKSGFFHTSH